MVRNFGGRDENGERMNPVALIVTIVLAPLAATLIQFALSRSREYMADASGAEISGSRLHLPVLSKNWIIMPIM